MAPDAFSKSLDRGMVWFLPLHDLAVRPPAAFDLSCKDPGAAKYLEGVTLEQGAGGACIEGLGSAPIWSRGLEMELIDITCSPSSSTERGWDPYPRWEQYCRGALTPRDTVVLFSPELCCLHVIRHRQRNGPNPEQEEISRLSFDWKNDVTQGLTWEDLAAFPCQVVCRRQFQSPTSLQQVKYCWSHIGRGQRNNKKANPKNPKHNSSSITPFFCLQRY